MEIFPVYCFDNNGRKVEVFHGFTSDEALNFVLRECWITQPNGFYLGISRRIEK